MILESYRALRLRYGRELISRTIYNHFKRGHNIKVLDIGCGDGDDLLNIQKQLGSLSCKVYGIESDPKHAEDCRRRGIDISSLDIERDIFPFPDKFFDVIIINQVLEHTKDVFWIISEISRTIKQGGMLVVGVPNLATWYDRLLLLFGQQPREIKIPGPHVRGFTRGALARFITLDDYFTTEKIGAAGFKPFPYHFQKLLAYLFPTLATSIIGIFKRTNKPRTFIDVLKVRYYDTNYFKGDQQSLNRLLN
jgi:methionine biosynthesis protein MetW